MSQDCTGWKNSNNKRCEKAEKAISGDEDKFECLLTMENKKENIKKILFMKII